MSEKKLHIEKGGYVSKEILLAYINGKLNAAETLQLEKLIAEDPFLSDAVNGLRDSDSEIIENSLSSINNKIDKLTGTKKIFALSATVRKYAAAATIIFFLGITFILMDRLNKETVQQKNVAIEPKASETETIIPADTNNNKSDMGGGSVVADSISENTEPEETAVAQTRATSADFDNEVTFNTAPVLVEDLSVLDNIESSTKLATTAEESKPGYTLPTVELADNNLNKETEINATFAGTVSKDEEVQTVELKSEKKNRKNAGKSKADDSAGEADITYVFSNMPGVDILIPPVSAPPMFPGGNDSLTVFIENIVAQTESGDDDKASASGEVNIKFLINEDGSVSDAFVLKGIGKKYDDNALNAVKNMPDWIPAQNNNTNITVWYTLIIKY